MKIAILGAGNSGCALAADYSRRGHEVSLIKTSAALHDENFEYLCSNGGIITMEEFGTVTDCKIARLTRDVSCISGQEIVIICTQTNYHKELLERCAPFLSAGQILLINPGYLSTAYALGSCPVPGLIIAESESTFIDGRLVSPGRFRAGFRNVRNPIGVYPASRTEEARAKLSKLGTPFEYLSCVLEAALHNPNMIVHTVGAIMSIPRIEATNGDYCMYHEVFTPSVWRMLEALDAEKLQILKRLGLEQTAYVDACKFRNSLDEQRPGKEVFLEYAAMPTRAKGPVTVASRYITEDVSQGLVLLESIGESLGIKTAIASSLIELAGAALGYSLRDKGRTLETLGSRNVRAILDDLRG